MKFIHHLVVAFLFLLIFSCNNENKDIQYLNKEEKILKDIFEKNYQEYYYIMTNNEKIFYLEDSILNFIKNNSIAENINDLPEKNIIDYVNFLHYNINQYEDNNFFSTEFDEPFNFLNRGLIKYKILNLEVLISKMIINYVLRASLDFDSYKILVVPKKENVRLNEEYSAHIYIIGAHTGKDYKVVIEGDTVTDYELDIINYPIAHLKAKKIGPNYHKAYIEINNFGDQLRVPFEIKYNVLE
ncbi:MAG: hypothetical protein H0V01_12775 [Bacteroidetes bacterium]|nr:hypothetical protein [Bacteroidota bacterium]HET6244223.1 hypothetical protein [Bacteroidia bacterium]